MALLNFAKTYEEVSDRLGLEESSSGDYVQLVFTGDGHIITHGVDYTPLFSAGKRGLVPGSSGKQTEFIRGNGKWLQITTQDLPIATSVQEAISSGTTNTTILNTQQIIEYVGNSIAANDAMVYKGTITYSDGQYTTHTTEGTQNDGFPTTCKIGDTYRVTTQGTYGGQTCEPGDLITCIKDGSGSSLNTTEYWTVIQTNINGQVKHTVNGTSIYTYSNSSNTFNIYAPTTGGTQGQVLISNGSAAPTWVNQNTIIAGDIADSVKKGLLTAVSLSATGVVSVSVGGTTKSSSAASGTWGINITGSANRVANSLSAGNGLIIGTTITDTYNGSAAKTISLKPASNTSLGGVIVDRDSENKTITVEADGNIKLTQANIINALGYTPGNQSQNVLYTTIIGSTSSSTANAESVTTNPYINLIQTQGSNKTVAGSYRLSGIGNIIISGQDDINISLNKADSSNYGGIKIGYTTDNNARNYAIQLSSTGQAYVNVPWANTTYSLATATKDGLVPKFDAVGTGSLAAGSWVLAKLSNGTYDWFALPSQAFTDTNTWRTIQVKGTQLLGSATNTGVLNFQQSGHTTVTGSGNTITISSTWRDITIGGKTIGNKTLNFIPSGDVYIKSDSIEDDIQDVSFGLSWYNISTKEYEIA